MRYILSLQAAEAANPQSQKASVAADDEDMDPTVCSSNRYSV